VAGSAIRKATRRRPSGAGGIANIAQLA
jgi:hypothetical protein